MTVLRDPQGATFTAIKFVPENKDLAWPEPRIPGILLVRPGPVAGRCGPKNVAVTSSAT
jgi:hypothetical protein